MVYLVGAGPGDPDLITRAGLKALWSADVVAYDRLVAPELIEEAPADAERIYVGKDPEGASTSQGDINRLLVDRALQGLTVVRLKGGDPFVFGRGAEEAIAVAGAGVPFQVIPGISAAVAVPAYAGIPVTHRHLAASFAVVTGQTGDGRHVDWPALATVDTLVLMMGVRALPDAARALMDGGRDVDEPVAIIERGTTAQQRVISGTLGELTRLALEGGIRPPATIVIGQVVRLRAAIEWFDAVTQELAPSSR